MEEEEKGWCCLWNNLIGVVGDKLMSSKLVAERAQVKVLTSFLLSLLLPPNYSNVKTTISI